MACLEQIRLNLQAMSFCNGLVMQIDIARMSGQNFRNIVTLFQRFPLVGKRNNRLLHIVFRRQKVVFLVAVECATQSSSFAFKTRGKVDVGPGNSVPPHLNSIRELHLKSVRTFRTLNVWFVDLTCRKMEDTARTMLPETL